MGVDEMGVDDMGSRRRGNEPLKQMQAHLLANQQNTMFLTIRYKKNNNSNMTEIYNIKY